MAANDDLRDSAIRHAAYLAKYGEGLADKIVAILNSADKDLAAKLAKGLNTDLTEKRFQELLAEIRILNNTVYGGAFETLEEELQKVAEVSAEYEADALSKAVPITSYRASLPSPNKLAKIAATSPIDGYLLKSWTDNMSANRTARVEKTLRIGMINGETIDQLTRRVMGTKAKGYKDGVLNVSRNSARSLAITANATIAARARKETHLANTDIIKQVMWLATLDTRTSPICQSRDGQTWKVDEKHPETPAHIRCRSLLVPVTKSYDELGIAKKEITKGDRASMDGQVPAKTTYGDWLAKQSEERQDSILGKQRADLFRSGNLPFKEMYRTDGSYKTVEELRSALGMSATKPEKRAEKAPESPKVDIEARDEEARSYCLKNGKRQQKEHLVAYDAITGLELQRNMGTRSSVSLDRRLIEKLNDPNSSVIIHHNHPKSTSFSPADVNIAAKYVGAKGIFAHGHDGSVFYAERSREPLSATAFDVIASRFETKLQKEVNFGRMTAADANQLFNHLVWRVVEARGQINYRAEFAGKSKKAWDANEKALEKMIKEVIDDFN